MKRLLIVVLLLILISGASLASDYIPSCPQAPQCSKPFGNSMSERQEYIECMQARQAALTECQMEAQEKMRRDLDLDRPTYGSPLYPGYSPYNPYKY